ncbi:MAG: hypothetical protein ACRDU8_07820 [Egibacteraceae bacterium]
MPVTRCTRVALLGLAAALLLTACGGEVGTASNDPPFNDADVAFLQMMIPPPRAGHGNGTAGGGSQRPP